MLKSNVKSALSTMTSQNVLYEKVYSNLVLRSSRLINPFLNQFPLNAAIFMNFLHLMYFGLQTTYLIMRTLTKHQYIETQTQHLQGRCVCITCAQFQSTMSKSPSIASLYKSHRCVRFALIYFSHNLLILVN